MSEGKHHHPQHGAPLLSERLVSFRRWLTGDAKCKIHPSLCIVNGEATDGTKNAPVLLYGPPTPAASARPKNHSGSSSASASKSLHSKGEGGASGAAGGGRCGMIDAEDDWALWDRTMGCQVRTVRELKKGEVAFDMPRGSMITPDVVAASDAGRAVLACCDVAEAKSGTGAGGAGGGFEMWDVFAGAAEATQRQLEKISHQSGTQLLVTILRERKKAEDVVAKARRDGSLATGYSLVPPGKVSSRAPFLAFLLQQRFCSDDPEVASSAGGADLPAGPALPPECPHTFAPYALTLPAVAPSPLCWKRNELALLAGCLAGTKPLQELASRTLLLSSDLIQLVRAGLLHRFPNLFPPGAVTWDTWVWAASMWESRTFPATCYLRKGETLPLMLQRRIRSHQGVAPQAIGNQQTAASPSKATETVWDDMGVVVPLLDMLNHETEAAQITWETPPATGEAAGADGTMGETDDAGDGGSGAASDGDVFPHPRAVTHKRVKKGCQVYNNYGKLSNQDLIVQYGFAHIGNGDDVMGVSWGFADAVGGVPMPSSYEPYAREVAASAATTKGDDGIGGENAVSSDLFSAKGWVFESSDPDSISRWWTPDRLRLLAQEANLDDSFIDKLRNGKKLSGVAYLDGLYHPIILSAAVVATMTAGELKNHTRSNGKSCAIGDGDGSTAESAQHGSRGPIHIKKGHQQRLRRYLEFLYVRKLEKLLSNINLGLKDHFNNVQIWDRATEGGLHYKGGAAGGNSQLHQHPAGGESMGWQTFFDSFAYASAMEVEKRYYAMGADSCVLTLYDGSLRCIQTSVDATSEEELPKLWKQLESVGFVVSDEDDDEEEEEEKKPAEEEEQKETDIVQVKQEQKEPAGDERIDPLDHDTKPQAAEATPSGTVTSVVRTDRDGNVNDSFRENHIKSETGNGSSNNDAKIGRHERGHSGYNRYGAFPGDQMGGNSGFGRDRRRIKAKGPAPVCGGSGGTGTGIGIPRPPAIKLHIGNLSYSTLPAELYEFFSGMYGASNVLECHIPTERETGKSRGFGFVTMPESVALKALESDKKHEIEGRVLKVARSNTAGSGKTSAPPPVISSDRCANCGYRPKYCTCPVPKFPGGPGGSSGPIAGAGTGTGFGGPPWEEFPTHDAPHGHRPYSAGDREAGWGRSRSWNRGRQSYSPSPLSRLSSSRSDSHRHRGRDRNYHDRRQRDYRRSRSYSYSRSRSPSSSRDRDRGRDRRRRSHGSRRKWRSRSRSRSWSRSRSRSRSRYSGSRSRSRSRSRTRSRSYDKGSPRKKDGDRMPPQSRGRSRSPSISRSKGTSGGSAEKKRSGKKRCSRSRSRSRSRGHGSRRKRRKSRSHSSSR